MGEKKKVENIDIEMLKRNISTALEGMCQLQIPEEEIFSIFQDIYKDIHNGHNKLRRYKDALFRMVFEGDEELLSLYNALNGSDYTDTDLLNVVTLDGYWFIGVKNDIAFSIMSNLYIFEQQSTICMNMPMRSLFYVTEMYRTMIDFKKLYQSNLQMIPEPHFITFYNGTKEMEEDVQILRLSDAYENIAYKKDDYEPELELVVHVYNINKGHNEVLLERCQVLKEYMEFVDIVRRNIDIGMNIDIAVVNAIDYCIEHDILSKFLEKNRDEVRSVVFADYSFEEFKSDTEEYIEELTAEILEKKVQLQEQSEQLQEQSEQLQEQSEQLQEQSEQLQEQSEQLQEQSKQLQEKDIMLEQLQQEIIRLKSKLKDE